MQILLAKVSDSEPPKTVHDPELMALLESLGSKSIPILAIFPKGNPDSPLVLRDLFTGGQLKEALDQELP